MGPRDGSQAAGAQLTVVRNRRALSATLTKLTAQSRSRLLMHRLGGVGIGAFERHEQSKRSFAELSNALSQAQVDHRDTIKNDPAFRREFQQMCLSIGVDPLAGPRKGGWWAELLGLGDWQYELGVQIVDVCISTRERNGGIIELKELVRLVSKLRGVDAGVITEDDVVRSIKTLQPLGAGYQVVELNGTKMVRSVVKELDRDQAAVLGLAHEAGGRIVTDILVMRLGWTRERSQAALDNMLLRDGLCWIDEQDEESGVSYWVPSGMQWDE